MREIVSLFQNKQNYKRELKSPWPRPGQPMAFLMNWSTYLGIARYHAREVVLEPYMHIYYDFALSK